MQHRTNFLSASDAASKGFGSFGRCDARPGAQWQLQPPPPQQPPPELGIEEPPVEDFDPLAGDAKTESCIVCFPLEHLGHSMFCVRLMTMRS